MLPRFFLGAVELSVVMLNFFVGPRVPWRSTMAVAKPRSLSCIASAAPPEKHQPVA